MDLKPIGNRVIVSLVEEMSTTQNGIIIPDTVKGNLKRGKIIAIGNSGNEVGSDLKVEDVIIFSENTGAQINVKNINYLILNAQDILAIHENNY